MKPVKRSVKSEDTRRSCYRLNSPVGVDRDESTKTQPAAINNTEGHYSAISRHSLIYMAIMLLQKY